MPIYAGNGLCEVDTGKPLSTDQERTLREYFILFQQAVLAWGTNLPANARGEHSCLGGHLSRLAVDVGAVNDYQVVIDMPSIEIGNQGLYSGFWMMLVPANTNTGASTLTVTPLGGPAHAAKAIQKGGVALVGGELVANFPVILVYNGTVFQVVDSPKGQVIQSVSELFLTATTTTAIVPNDDTIPQNTDTEGKVIVEATITPRLSTTKLRVRCQLFGDLNAQGVTWYGFLCKDNDADSLAAGWWNSEGGNTGHISFIYEMASPGTSAITFKLRAGATSGFTLTVNGVGGTRKLGGVLQTGIWIDEILV